MKEGNPKAPTITTVVQASRTRTGGSCAVGLKSSCNSKMQPKMTTGVVEKPLSDVYSSACTTSTTSEVRRCQSLMASFASACESMIRKTMIGAWRASTNIVPIKFSSTPSAACANDGFDLKIWRPVYVKLRARKKANAPVTAAVERVGEENQLLHILADVIDGPAGGSGGRGGGGGSGGGKGGGLGGYMWTCDSHTSRQK
mmetsp:Transcript_26712/g.53666  ORF Transcript_26712/g.53666 Transcript_26712/m.53666 type:complete len:200 (-) Transcript_26712:32-631(-)